MGQERVSGRAARAQPPVRGRPGSTWHDVRVEDLLRSWSERPVLSAALVATIGLHLAFPASEVFDHADGSKDAAVWAASAAVAAVASLVVGLVVWALLRLVAEGRPALRPEGGGAVQSSPAAVAATVAPSSQQASRSA